MISIQILKLYSVTILFCIVAEYSWAQSYYHSPNDTLSRTTALDEQVTMNITQIHPTADTIQFRWNQLSISMPMDWVASICDNSNCYTSLLNSGQTLPVLPGDDGLILIHCTPHTNTGVGIIRYTIYELSTPQNVDTLTWIVTVNELGINDISSSKNDFYVYNNEIHFLNPTNLPDELKLIDLSGKTIFYSKINDIETNLPILPVSSYILELQYQNQIIRQKIWLQN